MLKEKIRELDGALTERNPQWRNLLFDKTGKSYLGASIWDTKEGAVARMAKSITINAEREAKGIRTSFACLGGEVDTKDYAWHMQVPVL